MKIVEVTGFLTNAGTQAHQPGATNHQLNGNITGGAQSGTFQISNIDGDRLGLEAGQKFKLTLEIETAQGKQEAKKA